jgi:S-adenosylmethionine:tRNA ribosyltransferase-isomerase
MAVSRNGRGLRHGTFSDLPQWLRPGDLLVVNNTRVVPGRLLGRKASGGKVEALILDFAQGIAQLSQGRYCFNCLLRASKRVAPGTRLMFEGGLAAEVIDAQQETYRVAFAADADFEARLEEVGQVPLPPYIKRPADHPAGEDRRRYQTVYASQKGAIAAPTAGLHFTPALLARLKDGGVTLAELTLHVGYGTFRPPRVEDIREHVMHAESFHLPPETAAAVRRTRQNGGRIVAVGTTSVRTLEFAAGEAGQVTPGHGWCDLYIYPGYRFKIIDAMITNFHLPQSTLLMLVSAFAGRKRMLQAYQEAVAREYRFFSYGDAMLIQ